MWGPRARGRPGGRPDLRRRFVECGDWRHDTAAGLRAYGRIWAPVDRSDYDAAAAWWNLDDAARARGSAPAVQRARAGLTIADASFRGDLTLMTDEYGYRPHYLRTARGALVRLPAQLGVDGGDGSSGLTFNRHGTLAFTAKRDGRVHFLRCASS